MCLHAPQAHVLSVIGGPGRHAPVRGCTTGSTATAVQCSSQHRTARLSLRQPHAVSPSTWVFFACRKACTQTSAVHFTQLDISCIQTHTERNQPCHCVSCRGQPDPSAGRCRDSSTAGRLRAAHKPPSGSCSRPQAAHSFLRPHHRHDSYPRAGVFDGSRQAALAAAGQQERPPEV
jgi:hypothetical protein